MFRLGGAVYVVGPKARAKPFALRLRSRPLGANRRSGSDLLTKIARKKKTSSD